MKTTILALLLALPVLGCDFSEAYESESLPATATAKTAVIATSIMEPDIPFPSGPFACVPGLQVQLISVGAELRIHSSDFPVGGCEGTTLPTKHRTYAVTSAVYEDGLKTYSAHGTDGTIELVDTRQARDNKHPWKVTMVDYDLTPGAEVAVERTFRSKLVDDANLRASGEKLHDLVVTFKKPLAPTDVEKLCYSLVSDKEWSAPVGTDGTAYQMRILSDFETGNVTNQLTFFESVKSVEVIAVHEDPGLPDDR